MKSRDSFTLLTTKLTPTDTGVFAMGRAGYRKRQYYFVPPRRLLIILEIINLCKNEIVGMARP